MQENLRSNDMSCGFFTVEPESIGMANVRIVQKMFLTRPTVQHTRSIIADNGNVQRVYVRDGPDRHSKSNTCMVSSDVDKYIVGTKMFDFEKCCDLRV